MVKDRSKKAAIASFSRVIKFGFLTLAGIFTGFVFSILSASTANAAPTTVSGTISGIPDDAWGMAWGENL